MKKMIAIFFLVILAGCGNGEYDQAMGQAKTALESGDTEAALAAFETALDEKPEDAEAKSYYEQILGLNEVKEAINNRRWEAALSTALILIQDVGLDNQIKTQLDQYIVRAENGLREEEQQDPGDSGETKSPDVSSLKEEYLQKLQDVEASLASQRKILETGTQVDMTEAQGEILRSWDNALNEIYRELEKSLPENEMSRLREEQRKWIAYRDETAKEESLPYEGGSMQSLQYLSTQANLTEDRCYELVEGFME
ncbi:lysozyme inhibitor LprI family protein [Robertmurraya massiliosenegalensis]|uniref:lysozyme inhibitor LprI family protein n=1 Tax=Robertmurraya TaxID=2837507 RepID=UPI0039A50A33